MFVLVWSDNELLKSDNTVEVFPTYDRAYHEMVRQLEEEAARDGLTLSEGPGDLTAVDEYGFETGLVGYLDESEAYLDHHGECKWVIFEVPDSPTERKPYIAHIMVPLSVYFRAKSEREANYVAETIVADTDRLHELLGKVFADSGSNAFLSDVVCDSDEDGYADITLDASEVRQILDEQDEYK